MSIARTHSILIAAGMLLCSAAALADAPSVRSVDAKLPAMVLTGKMTRAAVLTDLRTAFAEGERIGTTHSGPTCDAEDGREWSQSVRQRVETELSKVFRDEIVDVGGLSAAPAEGAPLRVQAFLNDIDVQLCQAPANSWQGGFYVQVGWQVLSPDSGQVLYQASTEGSFMLTEPQRMPTAIALREALRVAVHNLLADRRFAAMLQPVDLHRVALGY